MKFGIIRETKKPIDKRVPFTPAQCMKLLNRYNNLEIVVQPSAIRCFTDEEYRNEGIPVLEDLSDCDILLGVKEVNKRNLIQGKTYLFFSHTIKKQDYNKKLLKTILEKNIRLIDYETLTDSSGFRIIGFGRYAGLVGAYNGLRAYAIRLGQKVPKPAHRCSGLDEMIREAQKPKLPAIKIALTGSGRVAQGAMELLNQAGVDKISVDDYLNKTANKPVYVQLEPGEYVMRKDGTRFNLEHFFKHPEQYENNFERFLPHTDLLIAAAFWDPKAPVLFTAEQVNQPDFALKVIADISCDINGSVPTTKRPSTIDEPFYDYHKPTGELQTPFSGSDNITVMAVDNLPCELPKDASEYFGEMLSSKIVPALIGDDPEDVIRRATITNEGQLTTNFNYLEEWVSK